MASHNVSYIRAVSSDFVVSQDDAAQRFSDCNRQRYIQAPKNTPPSASDQPNFLFSHHTTLIPYLDPTTESSFLVIVPTSPSQFLPQLFKQRTKLFSRHRELLRKHSQSRNEFLISFMFQSFRIIPNHFDPRVIFLVLDFILIKLVKRPEFVIQTLMSIRQIGRTEWHLTHFAPSPLKHN